jgi:hypothetical protein
VRRLPLVLLLALACTKGAEAPSEQDRLIAKLKAEQERIKSAPETERTHPAPDLTNPNFNTGEEDPLAKTAAEPQTPVNTLKLPDKLDFSSGKLTVHLNGVETTQAVNAGKVKLSTNERFLRVDLKLSAQDKVELDLSAASVQAGSENFPIARDAQRVVGTRNLTGPLGAGETREAVLMFELPDAALEKGVTLKLPLTPPLEVPLQ